MAHRYQYQPDAAGARDSGASRAAESDPLAELARLIGQSDPTTANFSSRATPLPQGHGRHQERHQEDRYQDQYQDQQPEPVAAEPAPPSWMRAAASSGWQQHQAPAVHPAAQPQAHYPAEEQAQQYQEQEYDDRPAFLRNARPHDQSRYDDVLYDQNSQNEPQAYAEGQYQDSYQEQSDPNGYPPFYADGVQDEPKRSRGGLITVVAVLVLAVVGTAAAYGYRSITGSPRSGEPPVIKAEPGANKIVPPTQTSDASGKIVDRIGGSSNGQERVLSREEQPIDINGRNAPRVVFPPLNQSGNPPAFATAPQTAPPATQQVASNGALSDEPKRVRTMTIRPDQPDTVPSGTRTASDAGARAGPNAIGECAGVAVTAAGWFCRPGAHGSSACRCRAGQWLGRLHGADLLAAERGGCASFLPRHAVEVPERARLAHGIDSPRRSGREGHLLSRPGRTVRCGRRRRTIVQQPAIRRRTVRRPKELTAVSLTLNTGAG